MKKKINFIRKIFFPVLIGFTYIISLPGYSSADSTWEEAKRLEKSEKTTQTSVIKRRRVEFSSSNADPFRIDVMKSKQAGPASAAPKVPLPKFTIQGIVWGGEVPQAIVDNKVVKPGDSIDNVHIVDINREGIDVFFNGAQYTLPSPAAAVVTEKKQNPGGEKNEK